MNELYDGVSACMSDPYSVFSYLSPERVRDLCAFIECKSFGAGEIIWNEGDPCDYVAFVASANSPCRILHQTSSDALAVRGFRPIPQSWARQRTRNRARDLVISPMAVLPRTPSDASNQCSLQTNTEFRNGLRVGFVSGSGASPTRGWLVS